MYCTVGRSEGGFGLMNLLGVNKTPATSVEIPYAHYTTASFSKSNVRRTIAAVDKYRIGR